MKGINTIIYLSTYFPYILLMFLSYNATQAQSNGQSSREELLDEIADHKVYGNSDSDNYLVFSVAGKIRKVYFEDVAVIQLDTGHYKVLFPEFGPGARYLKDPDNINYNRYLKGMSGKLADMRSRISIRFKHDPAWEQDSISLDDFHLNYLDSILALPGKPYDTQMREDAEVENLTIDHSDDRLSIAFQVSAKGSGNYLKGRITTSQVFKQNAEEHSFWGQYFLAVKHAYGLVDTILDTTRKIEISKIRYHVNKNQISSSYADDLPAPTGNNKVVVEMKDRDTLVYHYLNLSEDTVLIKVHRLKYDAYQEGSYLKYPEIGDGRAAISVDTGRLNSSNLEEVIVNKYAEVPFVKLKPVLYKLPEKIYHKWENQRKAEYNPEKSDFGLNNIPDKINQDVSAPPHPYKHYINNNAFNADEIRNYSEIMNYTQRIIQSDKGYRLGLKAGSKIVIERSRIKNALQRQFSSTEYQSLIRLPDTLLNIFVVQRFGELPEKQVMRLVNEQLDKAGIDTNYKGGPSHHGHDYLFFLKDYLKDKAGRQFKKFYITERFMAAFLTLNPENTIEDINTARKIEVLNERVHENFRDNRLNTLRSLLRLYNIIIPESINMKAFYAYYHRQLIRKYGGSEFYFYAMDKPSSVKIKNIDYNVLINESGYPEKRSYTHYPEDYSPGARRDKPLITRTVIDYMPDKKQMRIKAENSRHGKTSITFDAPRNLLDVAQFESAVASLPLEAGYETDLYFFDMAGELSMQYGNDPDKLSGTIEEMTPVFTKVQLNVTDKTSIRISGENHKVYKVKALFSDDVAGFDFILNYDHLIYDKYTGQGAAILYVAVNDPHEIRKIQLKQSTEKTLWKVNEAVKH